MRRLFDVDPAALRLPTTPAPGADTAKLARQISRYGNSVSGLPPSVVVRAAGGELVINDGVTRTTRVAKLLPGKTVWVEVTAECPNWSVSTYPTVKDRLP